ncbi:hypothetical protein [Halomonas cupida]|uniref:hypothetical protein n=1 Tax=Halomonas cupida TaxID=44933 RepID=UPI003A90CC0A
MAAFILVGGMAVSSSPHKAFSATVSAAGFTKYREGGSEMYIVVTADGPRGTEYWVVNTRDAIDRNIDEHSIVERYRNPDEAHEHVDRLNAS